MNLAFDMFGTLVDTQSVARSLEALCGDRAAGVATLWRQKQLEYMFRTTAMERFERFADLTQWGLEYALSAHGLSADPSTLEDLVLGYSRLEPFADTRAALAQLREAGHRVAVFSVGPEAWLHDLVHGGGLDVELVVSSEHAGRHKPHPAVYAHLVSRLDARAGEVVLVSGNPFDLIAGAVGGLRTAWCRRSPDQLFDPWGPRPDITVSHLGELASQLPRGA